MAKRPLRQNDILIWPILHQLFCVALTSPRNRTLTGRSHGAFTLTKARNSLHILSHSMLSTKIPQEFLKKTFYGRPIQYIIYI